MKRISTLFGGAVLGVALLAACGGGGGGAGTSAPSGPLPPAATAAPPDSAPQAFSASDAVAIPAAAAGAASVPVPLPSDPSGASANASLPANGSSIPADTTIAATYATSGDASLPTLSRARHPNARTTRDDSKRSGIAYLKLQFSADVTLPQAPAFTFTVPGTLPTNGVAYWLAFLDPLRSAAGWQTGFEGPATVSPATVNGKGATQLAFASNGKPISFTAGQTYWFAVVAVSATAATPTPVPSTVPSNPPPDGKPAPVLVTPRTLQFAAVTDAPKQVTFVQQNFTGAFTLHGDCTGIVNTSGASPTWTIIPVAAGRCVIVGLGDRGASAVVHVGVVTPYETPRPDPSPTSAPSHPPTSEPTHPPSTEPTHPPSTEPTHPPSTEPTHPPSTEPTHPPSTEPTHPPSPEPTHPPSTEPTHPPSPRPSPTASPGSTQPPGVEPTHAPTQPPSATPSPSQNRH